MIERGKALVADSGLATHIEIVQANLNEWAPAATYDVFIANHSLHHVVELERLFACILGSMSDDGVFFVNDMIGRNGHALAGGAKCSRRYLGNDASSL